MTPQELDTRLEDAVLLEDGAGLQGLYDGRAVVVGPGWVGGPARALEVLTGHVAGRLTVLGDVAVSVTGFAVTVAHLRDGRWRLVASVARAQPRTGTVVRSDVGVTAVT